MRFVGIDPSTMTGFVALSESGEVLRAKELTGIGTRDPKRMITMIDEIVSHIHKDDLIVIEGFGFASQQAIQLGGIGWGIRMALHRRGIEYYEASPAAVKKFSTGKGNVKKDEMVLPLFKRWRFEHASDNVRDAFVLSRIAMNIFAIQEGGFMVDSMAYQGEVINTILYPKPKSQKKKKAK